MTSFPVSFHQTPIRPRPWWILSKLSSGIMFQPWLLKAAMVRVEWKPSFRNPEKMVSGLLILERDSVWDKGNAWNCFEPWVTALFLLLQHETRAIVTRILRRKPKPAVVSHSHQVCLLVRSILPAPLSDTTDPLLVSFQCFRIFKQFSLTTGLSMPVL